MYHAIFSFLNRKMRPKKLYGQVQRWKFVFGNSAQLTILSCNSLCLNPLHQERHSPGPPLSSTEMGFPVTWGRLGSLYPRVLVWAWESPTSFFILMCESGSQIPTSSNLFPGLNPLGLQSVLTLSLKGNKVHSMSPRALVATKLRL